MKKILGIIIVIFLFTVSGTQALEFTFSDKDYLNGASWGTMYITSYDENTLQIEYFASPASIIPKESQATGFGFSFSGNNTVSSITNPEDNLFIYDRNDLNWIILTNLNSIPNPGNGDEFSPRITKDNFFFGATEGDANNINPPGIKSGERDIFYLNFNSKVTPENVLLTGVRLQSLPNNINEGSLFLAGKIPAPVPEPATMLLLGSGLIGLAGFGRRKFKK